MAIGHPLSDAVRRRRYAMFFVLLPQIDMEHHMPERFFDQSQKTYSHWAQVLSRGNVPEAP